METEQIKSLESTILEEITSSNVTFSDIYIEDIGNFVVEDPLISCLGSEDAKTMEESEDPQFSKRLIVLENDRYPRFFIISSLNNKLTDKVFQKKEIDKRIIAPLYVLIMSMTKVEGGILNQEVFVRELNLHNESDLEEVRDIMFSHSNFLQERS